MEDGAEPCSYAELHRRMLEWSGWFRQRGVVPGDRVAALGPASVDLVAAMLGAYAQGVIWVPINDRYRALEIEHILEDCRPKLLLCDPQHRESLRAAHPPAFPFERPRDQAPAGVEPLPDDAAALLIYTSGTTGRSKGVELSHAAVVQGIEALTDAWRWTAADVLSLQLPVFHVHGLCIGIHGALLAGMKTLLHPRFDVSAVVTDVRDRGATVFMGVPTMYTRLLDHLDAHPCAAGDLRRARLFTAGSAALRAADLQRFERHTGHRILERYGMSETLITLSNPHDAERRAGSVGLEVPGVRIRVVDDTGQPVVRGEVGELQVQTPAMMTGYWQRPEATAAAFDGAWFRTGDVVCQDDDGYVRIVGRMSVDIIKSGGFKISAREIEEVLASHPAVREVAVVGLPDAKWGERIVAAVVLRDALSDLGVLVEHARASLADFKKPRAIHAVARLPRNALGKLQKVELKRRLLESDFES